ncbi:MAG: hypothetical protein ACLFMO_00720 [Eubacteriales bacterium]
MNRSFTIFELVETIEDIPIKIPFKMILTKRHIKNKTYKKILKKTPLKKSIINIMGIEGYRVQLPITTDIIKEKDANYIKTIINSSVNDMINEESILFIFPDELIGFVQELEIPIVDGKLIPFLLLDQVIEKCCNVYPKKMKDIHFVLIDGQDTLTNYCIDLIYSKINYLTIITDRASYYNEITEEIFQETGLIVEIIESPLLQKIESDIIINCDNSQNKAFYFFNKNAFLIDFITQKESIRNILIKRKDLRVIDDLSYVVNNESIDSKLLQAIIFSQNRALRSWMLYGYKSHMLDRINRLFSQYNVKISGLYQYGRKIEFN